MPVSPRHFSHGSHAFSHDGTGVHGAHFVGSPASAMVHVVGPPTGEPSQTNLPVRGGSSQQPKQSQPFGVSGTQKSLHAASCGVAQFSGFGCG
jgi:hypothetical protein